MRRMKYLMVVGLCLAGWTALATDMPKFSVKDPANMVHTQQELLERGAVVLVTIPNFKHGIIQSTWSQHLEKQIPAGGPRLVIVEDLSQSNLRENARKSMKDAFKPGQATLLLLDEDGSLRRAFGIQNDETVVLIYGKDGSLIRQVASPETSDELVDVMKDVGKLIEGMDRKKE